MKEKLYPVVVLLLIGALLVFAFFNNGRSYFILELHGMDDLEISNIIVEGPDFTTGFYMTAQVKKEMSVFKINVDSPINEGTATITINIDNSSPLVLSNMPFKNGKTIYISLSGGNLNYVKAHW
ncbi:hypothetical protein [Alteromonas naphthalenivorans]|jgi:hypothetical protein|uniref:Uncharacterized protein n=1 Tax=Alteromonas naphthalenivorans TaxID=715451 RepID=F5Z889_ALTNA|nr:hypothetical protein [Alteromonas naphthalenivorans]AEF03282.1 hypothetical protein ambt_08780 [Alteromonas naphthalenivorans]|tara:strand:- start:708 stop:1079 length:372 start_codon:yes stop_codon:yes gene_type:complete